MSESMSDEELEKALEKGNLDLDIDDEPKETEPVDTTPKPKYAPTDEILNADFTSGLIQIGNDVFQCGGYITLKEFVEKYGDNWKCYNGDVPYTDFNLEAPISDIEKEIDNSYVFVNNELRVSVQVLYKYKDLNECTFEKVFQKYTESTGIPAETEENILSTMVADINEIKSSPINEYWIAETHYGSDNVSYEYAKDSTIGDLIVINVLPISAYVSPQYVFYPSETKSELGIEYSEENAKNFFKTYLNSSDEIFDTESIPDMSNKKRIMRQGASKHVSTIHMSNLADGKIIKADFGENSKVYYKNISLKDTNLLNYKPTISIAYFGMENNSMITYSEFELNKNSILIPYSTFTYSV